MGLTAAQQAALYFARKRRRVAAKDEHFADVVMLLGGDAIVDLSRYGRPLTASGEVASDPNNQIMGRASLLFDGSGDYITAPAADSLALGSRDFTIEGFVRFSEVSSDENGDVLASQWTETGDQRGWFFHRNAASGQLRFVASSNGLTGDVIVAGSWSPVADTLYHLAAVRSGSDISIYVNGARLATGSHAGDVFDSSDNLSIGRVNTTSVGFQGYHTGWISEFRMTVGVARYSGASFTAPSEPFPRS